MFYPQKQKYETKVCKNSSPIINEYFICKEGVHIKNSNDPFKGKFISFTIYAIFGKEDEEENHLERKRGLLKRYFSFNGDVFTRNSR